MTNKTGDIVGSKLVNDHHDILLISAAGIIIRMKASDISSYSRNAQGVKMMDLEKGDKVAALAIVDTVSDEEKETENAIIHNFCGWIVDKFLIVGVGTDTYPYI